MRDPYSEKMQRLTRAVLVGPGRLAVDARQAAASSGAVSAEALGYMQKVARAAYRVTDDDVAALRAAGISPEGINDATYICALFSIIDRITDALDFTVPASFKAGRSAKLFLWRGYR